MKQLIRLHALACLMLLASCSGSSDDKASKVAPRSVDLNIQLSGLQMSVPVELDSGSAGHSGTHSFSSSEANGRDLATSISHCFVGAVDLKDGLAPSQIRTTGDVIAVRVTLHDPKTNESVLDKTIFTTYYNSETSVFDDLGIKVSISPPKEIAE